MNIRHSAFSSIVTVLSLLFAAISRAVTPAPDPVDALATVTKGQQNLTLRVRVVDAAGKPVAKARVSPWALRSSQGHGWWAKNDERAAVESDGTFVIDGWPADKRLQLIALCDGYIATSGDPPNVVKDPRDPKSDPYHRPQVFDVSADQPIEVAMTPLVRCIATAVDEDDEPIANVKVSSWPNVGWWNDGSQIYCHPLVRGEKVLHTRDYSSAGTDKTIPPSFRG